MNCVAEDGHQDKRETRSAVGRPLLLENETDRGLGAPEIGDAIR